MKYLKTFENNIEPQIGDYCVARTKAYLMLSTIIDYDDDYYTLDVINFISDRDTRDFKFTLNVRIDKILYYSKSLKNVMNKFEELKETEPFVTWILNNDANKYNL